MLVGAITSTYLHEGLKFVTPYEQYVGWRNNINFIFIRDQNSPPTMINLLIGVITSTLSSWPPEVRRGATSGLQRTGKTNLCARILNKMGNHKISEEIPFL
jgi:hypothetical protein